MSDDLQRTPSWPIGSGEMAERIRAHDWAATPLGPIEAWPERLKSAVDLVLASPVAMIVLWGPALVQIYNDACRAVMAGRHPAGLGQPARAGWPQLWPFDAPVDEAVFRGEARSFAAQKLVVERLGRPEDAWFDLAYSPLRDQAGAVAGVLVTVVETTAKARGEAALRASEERQAFLLKLSDALRPFAEATAIMRTASTMLGLRLGVTRCGYAEIDEAEWATYGGMWSAQGVADLPARAPMPDYGRLLERYKAGQTVVVDDVLDTPLTRGDEEAIERVGPLRAFIAAPLIKNGRFAAAQFVMNALPRRWTAAERDLVQDVADRTWAAVERARAEAALRDSEERYRTLFEAIDEGFYFIRAIFDEDGRCADLFYQDENPAAVRVVGRSVKGRRMSELGAYDQSWRDIFGQVARTGGAHRMERFAEPDGRWYDFYAFKPPHAGPDDLAVVFRDATERKRAEAALRASEERFRSFGENSADTLWIIDAETWRLEYLSPAFQAMWGESRDRVMADLGRWAELLHPDDRARALEGMPRLLAGEVFTSEYRIVRPSDGAVRWIRDTGFPIRDAAGRVRRAAGIARDITERKRAETALAESEERFRLVVENARDYAIFVTDPRDIVADWFPGAAAVFGWSADEIVGQPGALLFTPEDRAAGRPAQETETARTEGTAPNVRWHLRKDGSRVFIEGQVVALDNPDGSPRGFLKIGQDVTERRKAEEQFARSEALFRTLATGIQQLVFLSDPDGSRTWGSPQWVDYAGLSFPDSLGFGWLEAIHPDDRNETLRRWTEAAQTGDYYVEHRVRRGSDGAYRWHQTRARPLGPDDGVTSEWVGASTDVHDLRELQESQAVMVAELQHRTRNLIAVVRSIAGQTMRASDTMEAFTARFNDRLAALSRVQGLLSRSEREPITIGALIRQELDALGAEAVRDRVRIEGPETPLRNAVVQTLALAIHELATNARKYGALVTEDGRLDVTWRVRDADGAGRRLALEWIERGVDRARKETSPAAERGGYGRELIERALPYALGARTSFELGDDGVRCTIDLPLDKRPEQGG